ncbi:hypothetical protein K6R49_003737 [Escherichia coli]|uniref:hypothetical protein n=1 Tax=Buttiauxella noackiae TaxID=82992 RepID=UPI0019F478C7|nr:hypothetical protein [Escherichia coli]MBJ0329705.1 hypothetical protein [Escherichia coli]
MTPIERLKLKSDLIKIIFEYNKLNKLISPAEIQRNHFKDISKVTITKYIREIEQSIGISFKPSAKERIFDLLTAHEGKLSIKQIREMANVGERAAYEYRLEWRKKTNHIYYWF